MSLLYTENLKAALTELGSIDKQLTRLKIKKDEIRQNCLDWLNINQLTEYEIYDSTETDYWRLQIIETSRSTLNKETLINEIGSDVVDRHTETKETTMFKCQPVKNSKTKVPRAPRGK